MSVPRPMPRASFSIRISGPAQAAVRAKTDARASARRSAILREAFVAPVLEGADLLELLARGLEIAVEQSSLERELRGDELDHELPVIAHEAGALGLRCARRERGDEQLRAQ